MTPLTTCCPDCQKRIKLDPQRKAQKVTCPRCKVTFKVASPTESGQAAAPLSVPLLAGMAACFVVLGMSLAAVIALTWYILSGKQTGTQSPPSHRVEGERPPGETKAGEGGETTEAMKLERWGPHTTNSIGMKLVRIPPGRFLMGVPAGEVEFLPGERPQHEVDITKQFWMGVYEVTQSEYQKVTSGNPSHFSRTGGGLSAVTGMDTSAFPVDKVSWHDANRFCVLLSDLAAEKRAGRMYRLPTEAEWEYACRAGTTTPYHFGQSLDTTLANKDDRFVSGGQLLGSSLGRTAKVGSYSPNAFGLYDMHGNVKEWCQDWYSQTYYGLSPKEDPQGPNDGYYRVYRGGAFTEKDQCRSSTRAYNDPNKANPGDGFRVVCLPIP